MLKRPISCAVLIAFVISMVVPYSHGWATEPVLGLPMPGSMVSLSPAYTPVLIKGLKINPTNPLALDFIVDTGNSQLNAQDQQLKTESERLIKYFFAALTLPEKDVWVNLSPYEKDRIVPEATGNTEMGRDMLAQDYILKQITASLIYPEKGLGKDFWNRIYKETQDRFGTTQIPVNTFNKVWIVADKASVYEAKDTVLVVDAHLKVMLEGDYLAMSKHDVGAGLAPAQDVRATARVAPTDVNQIGSNIVREIVLPALEKEVNEGKNFANLRQIFHSLILAKWYKESLKTALLNQVYSDKNKVAGVDVQDKSVNEKIYQQYLQAYKKGVFNYIKEDVNQITQERMPKKYFSGGVTAAMVVLKVPQSQAMFTLRNLGTLIIASVMATSAPNALAQSINRAKLKKLIGPSSASAAMVSNNPAAQFNAGIMVTIPGDGENPVLRTEVERVLIWLGSIEPELRAHLYNHFRGVPTDSVLGIHDKQEDGIFQRSDILEGVTSGQGGKILDRLIEKEIVKPVGNFKMLVVADIGTDENRKILTDIVPRESFGIVSSLLFNARYKNWALTLINQQAQGIFKGDSKGNIVPADAFITPLILFALEKKQADQGGVSGITVRSINDFPIVHANSAMNAVNTVSALNSPKGIVFQGKFFNEAMISVEKVRDDMGIFLESHNLDNSTILHLETLPNGDIYVSVVPKGVIQKPLFTFEELNKEASRMFLGQIDNVINDQTGFNFTIKNAAMIVDTVELNIGKVMRRDHLKEAADDFRKLIQEGKIKPNEYIDVKSFDRRQNLIDLADELAFDANKEHYKRSRIEFTNKDGNKFKFEFDTNPLPSSLDDFIDFIQKKLRKYEKLADVSDVSAAMTGILRSTVNRFLFAPVLVALAGPLTYSESPDVERKELIRALIGTKQREGRMDWRNDKTSNSDKIQLIDIMKNDPFFNVDPSKVVFDSLLLERLREKLEGKRLDEIFSFLKIYAEKAALVIQKRWLWFRMGQISITNPKQQSGIEYFLKMQKPGEEEMSAYSKGQANPDRAALALPNGGIDLDSSKFGIQKTGSGVEIKFDPVLIEQFKLGNFNGIVPVIIGIIPISNIYPLLGLKEPEENEKLAKI